MLFRCALSSSVRGYTKNHFPKRCWKALILRDVIMSCTANCSYWSSCLHWGWNRQCLASFGGCRIFSSLCLYRQVPCVWSKPNPAFHSSSYLAPDEVLATPSYSFPKYQAAIPITFMYPQCAKDKKSQSIKMFNIDVWMPSSSLLIVWAAMWKYSTLNCSISNSDKFFISLEHMNKITFLM